MGVYQYQRWAEPPDFREVSGSSLVARVTIELELHDARTGASVWAHFYSHDEPVERKDISAVVGALDHDIQKGITEFRASLDQYFSAHPAATTMPTKRMRPAV